MARGRRAALVAAAALVFTGTATAATPQEIYRDLADNNRLDREYSQADINRALPAPLRRRYAERLPARTPAGADRPIAPDSAPVATARGSLPFSGLDLALFGGVGGPLLLLGASLGRLARTRRTLDG